MSVHTPSVKLFASPSSVKRYIERHNLSDLSDTIKVIPFGAAYAIQHKDGRYLRTTGYFMKNPGTNWHIDRADEHQHEGEMQSFFGHPVKAELYKALAKENKFAAQSSRERGMNPTILVNPRGMCPICKGGKLSKGRKFISCPSCGVSWTVKGKLHRNPCK